MQPMHQQDPRDQTETDTADRRSNERRPYEARVTVQVDTREFAGTSRNLSQAGIFFFSGDRLRVSVQIHDEQGLRTCQGNLVRVERMDAQTTGFAIEFDR